MDLAPTPPHGEFVAATKADYSRLSRLAKAGKAQRLAPGLYAIGATLPPEQVARHHLHAAIAAVWPDAVLCHRTAFVGGIPADGTIYLAHPEPRRTQPLRLPGVSIIPLVGPSALPGDIQLPNGLWMSGPARALIENVALRGRPPKSKAGTATVDDRIDELARSGGAGRVRSTLEQLDVIARSFDPSDVEHVRERLAAVLGSFADTPRMTSGRLAARLAGTPYDAHRIEMMEELVKVLLDRPPIPRPAAPPVSRWEWLAFFEAYFSNFIEGTEFGVDEARRIAVDGIVPETRPQDAHDVSATYRLAIDPTDRARIPGSGDELVALLRDRHAVLMDARPEMRPGELKDIPNFAGGYQFVEPSLVEGTLVKGYDVIDPLHSPLARATAMMALVTECHPFDDGNGRIARLASNAELSAAGEVRLIIPNVYRNNYLAALSGFSNRAGQGEQLIAVLEFAQRWAGSIDWTTYEGAHEVLTNCNAFEDPNRAENLNIRLTMPQTE